MDKFLKEGEMVDWKRIKIKSFLKKGQDDRIRKEKKKNKCNTGEEG